MKKNKLRIVLIIISLIILLVIGSFYIFNKIHAYSEFKSIVENENYSTMESFYNNKIKGNSAETKLVTRYLIEHVSNIEDEFINKKLDYASAVEQLSYFYNMSIDDNLNNHINNIHLTELDRIEEKFLNNSLSFIDSYELLLLYEDYSSTYDIRNKIFNHEINLLKENFNNKKISDIQILQALSSMIVYDEIHDNIAINLSKEIINEKIEFIEDQFINNHMQAEETLESLMTISSLTLSDIYIEENKLIDSIKEKALIKITSDIREAYFNKEINAEKALMDLSNFEADSKSKVVSIVANEIQMYEDSKKAYLRGVELYNSKKYGEAQEYLSSVIEADENYSSSQEYINIINNIYAEHMDIINTHIKNSNYSKAYDAVLIATKEFPNDSTLIDTESSVYPLFLKDFAYKNRELVVSSAYISNPKHPFDPDSVIVTFENKTSNTYEYVQAIFYCYNSNGDRLYVKTSAWGKNEPQGITYYDGKIGAYQSRSSSINQYVKNSTSVKAVIDYAVRSDGSIYYNPYLEYWKIDNL